jgi:hypothetical protein
MASLLDILGAVAGGDVQAKKARQEEEANKLVRLMTALQAGYAPASPVSTQTPQQFMQTGKLELPQAPEGAFNIPGLGTMKKQPKDVDQLGLLELQRKMNQDIFTRGAKDRELGLKERELGLKGKADADKPIFKTIPITMQKEIIDMQDIPTYLEKILTLSDDVPENRAEAAAYYGKMSIPGVSSFATTPAQRALKTNTELLIQKVLKTYQGARPSDEDRKVMARAINAISEGRENYKIALNELKDLSIKRMDQYSDSLSKGYEIDKDKLDDIIGVKKLLKTSPLKKDSSAKKIKVGGEEFTIYGN